MRLEPATLNRIEVQRLLIELDLLLEANLRDGYERLTCAPGALDFDSKAGVACDRVGQTLLARRAIVRRARCRTAFTQVWS